MTKRLDKRCTFPVAMSEYLSKYGWHFNDRLCEHAVSLMRDRYGNKVAMSKEQADDLLSRHDVPVPENHYDHVYVLAMATADYLGSSIDDEHHLALYVRDYLNDPDGYDEIAMTRYYADCIGAGRYIPWEDVV